jgi:hypothetical protein
MFADDTNLLSISKNIFSPQSRLNRDLRGLYKWLLANKISINAAKTELVILNSLMIQPTVTNYTPNFARPMA